MRRYAGLLVALAALLLTARVVASAGHTAYLPILRAGPPEGPPFPVAPTAPADPTAAPTEPTVPGDPSPTATPSIAAPTATVTSAPSVEPTATATQTPSATAIPPTATPDALARVVDLINGERTSRGLGPVARSTLLDAAAQGHSEDMASHDLFSHTGSNGSSVADRLHAVGYSWRSCGEIIAAGYTTPEGAVQGWMGSDGHRAIILTAGLTEIGVGLAFDADSAYRYYWTADFATP